MAYVNSLCDIQDALSAEYYDPRDNISKILYEENRRKQNFAFGIVTDNQDPDGRGRIKVSLPMTARGYISKWIWVCHSYAGDGKGFASLPDINDQVLVAFIGGDIHQPVCVGGMYTPRHRPPIADNEDNNIKAIKTPGAYLIMDDTPGEERLEASIKDGKIRVEIDTKGIHLTNELGPVNLKCRKLTLSGQASRWKTEKDVTVNADGNISVKTNSAAALSAGGDVTVKGASVDLKGSTGVTAEGKQIAKGDDPVAGVDLHDIEVPSGHGTQRVPAIPHPYIGKLSDKLSSDVNIKDKPVAVEGSVSEFSSPGHFPMPPGVKFSSNPDNKGEVTKDCIDSVQINGTPVAVLGSTVTTCSDAGQQDQCVIMAPGATVTFPIQYPGQDPEQYRRDGGLPVNVSSPAVYTAEEAAYANEPKSLTNLQWSESKVEKGTEVTLSCTTSGVKDGAGVMFSIYPEGADPEVDPPVMDLRGPHEGGRAEVKWYPRDMRKEGAFFPMKWFFTAWTLYCPKETSEITEVVQTLNIQLLAGGDNPVADAAYILIHPDGSKTEGTTDNNGKIEERNLIPGEYKIKFSTNE